MGKRTRGVGEATGPASLSRLRDPLGRAKQGTSRARVRGNFVIVGTHRAAREVAKRGPVATATDRYGGRAEAAGCLAAEVVLDDAVFERVKADDHKAATVGAPISKAEQAVGLRKDRVKAVEFAIDTDPERKEDLGGGVNLGSAPCAPHSLLDGSGQFPRRPQRTGGNQGASDA